MPVDLTKDTATHSRIELIIALVSSILENAKPKIGIGSVDLSDRDSSSRTAIRVGSLLVVDGHLV